MIAVVDLGFGNLNSVRWALERLRAEVLVTSDPAVLRESSGIVLPGVGHFGAAADRLAESGLGPVLRERAGAVPILGICLGMQLLFDWSEEGGEGLGLLPGAVRRMGYTGLPLPHTGWNAVDVRPDAGFLAAAGSGEAYFVHSYAVDPEDGTHIAAYTEYGERFPSAVRSGLIAGVQFHPERSGAYGRRVLAAYLGEVKACSKSSRPSTSRLDASSA
ncbi:MAG: imidazole glycerol phosphate synthase subunit HisH [Thermaerobacter sp.]|nr:imidazole glycerol phosphate synthase subunit HisH [Thermaerobacter sp.]